MPFVFARLCANAHYGFFEKMAREFLRTQPNKKSYAKIPQYVLEKYAKKCGVTKTQIKEYLKLIHYEMGTKEKKGLKKFLKLSKKLKS